MTDRVKSSKNSSLQADATSVININATTNNKENPVVQFFKAGTYEVRVIGTSEGGEYDAWSLWNFTTGCDEKGENCVTGWVNGYDITSSEFTINISNTGKYSTPEQALAKAQSTSFTLTSDNKVNFFLSDELLTDNRGGVSLAVKKVREDTGYPQLKVGSWIILVITFLSLLTVWILVNLITSHPAR